MGRLASFVGFLACFFLGSGPVEAQTRRALLIGVGNYPHGSGWRAINAANDLRLLQEVLQKQHFIVHIIAEEDATKANIVQGLEQLEREVDPSDHVFLHFSGHGQQIQDDNDDEFDGLDEALVPYDAPMEYTPGYRGERHWRDDEIGTFLNSLRAKLGPTGQVFTTFDACHSGTATRGWSVARGTEVIQAPPGVLPPAGNSAAEVFLEDPSSNADYLAPIISFFAGSPQELNREFVAADGKFYGPLSYSVAKVWLAHLNQRFSYRALFNGVRAEMTLIAPRQHPKAEGNLEESLWGSAADKATGQYAVISVWDATTVRIDAGQLQGISEGSIVHFESLDGGQVLAKGTITYSELSWAEVSLDVGVDRREILSSLAIVEFRAAGKIRCRVNADFHGNTNFEDALKTQFDRYGITQTASSIFDLFLDLDDQGLCRIWTRDEILLYEEDLSAIGFDAEYLIEETFLPYMQGGFIRSLAIDDPSLKGEIRVVPLRPDGRDEYMSSAANIGVLQLPEGTRFVLEIKNSGPEPFYFSVLDLQPDNRMSLIVPEAFNHRTAEDYFLMPGVSRRIDEVWEVSPPFGMETIKLILSDKPLQLASIMKTRGASFVGKNYFETLLAYSFQPGSRGLIQQQPTVAERITLQDFHFEIIQR